MHIHLLEPANGSVTEPLQKFFWPEGEEAASSEAFDPIAWDDLEIVGSDRTHAQPVFFAWEVSGAADDFTFDMALSPHEDLRKPHALKGLRHPRAEVLHLHIGTVYHWSVTARVGEQEIARSPVWSFTTHSATPRWITVPGISNVRDMGGWPLPGGRMVKQGLIYRSSEMAPHVVITKEGRHILEDDLKIKTDLDLRKPEETPVPVLDTGKVRWINIPVMPYNYIIERDEQERYRQVFAVLADPSNYPVLFHCWGGADRGGTVAFLLGALLGKSLENLSRDYELTSFSIWGIRSRHSEEFRGMLAALHGYAPSGSLSEQVEYYLLDTGVTAEQIAAFRDSLIAESRA